MLPFQKYIDLANVARSYSDDMQVQIGAVIVTKNGENIVSGRNRFPEGVKVSKERQIRENKYPWIVHAETNAIATAAKLGIPTDGATMYMTCGIPCNLCTNSIISAGIKKIVCAHEDSPKNTGAKGKMWTVQIENSITALNEANVEIEYYK